MRPLQWLPLAAALLAVPLAAGAVTADELAAKNLAARGGAAKLRAVATARWSGKARLPGGVGEIEADYTAVAKRPGRIRSDIVLQGFDYVEAYDGRGGWKIDPSQGRRDAERMSADDAKPMVEAADFASWLLDYKAKGCRLAYLGTEDVDGTQAHKLKLTRPNGDFHYLFLDPDHFLEIRVETHRWVRGAEEVSETDLGEYQNVGGLFWPFLVATGRKGSPERQVTMIDKLELDAPVDDAVFRFPDAPAKKHGKGPQ